MSDRADPSREDLCGAFPRAAADSEIRHRLLIESWTQAVWETDAAGVVVTDSPSWRAYTGQSLKEWLGYGWLDAIHPGDRAYAERQWREAMAARSPVNAEFRLRAPDGGWRWTNVRAAPVLDPHGSVEKWVGMNIDIDARKRAEAAVRESEEKYRSLFESMDQAFGIVELVRDADGRGVDYRYIELNPALTRHTGMSPERLVGRRASEVFGTVDPWLIETYRRVVDEGQSVSTEHYFSNVGRWLRINVFPWDGDQLVALYSDVSDRHRAQAILEQSEARQTFLLKFTDALRSEPNEQALIEHAVRMLANHLAVDRAYATRHFPDQDLTHVVFETRRPGLAPLPAQLRFSDFPEAGRQTFERTLVFEDTANDASLSEEDKASLAAMGVGALLSRPLRRNGSPIFALGVVSSSPRRWTSSEVALVEDATERTWDAAERARAEMALRNSEERASLAMEVGGLGAWDWDIRTGDVTWSREHFEMQGYAPGQVKPSYQAWLERVHPDDREGAERALIEARDQRIPYRQDFRGLLPDGRIRHLQAQGRFFYDPDGNAVRMLGVMRDVTEETVARVRVLKSEERLRGVLESMAEGFALLDSAFRIIDVNAETLRLDGRARGELIGQTHWTAFPGSEEGLIGDTLRRVSQRREPDTLEHRYSWPDGRAAWLDMRAYPTAEGGVAIFWRDITDRKEAQAALSRSEERYRALFDSMDEAYAVVEVLKDDDGRWNDFLFIEVNPAFMGQTGMPYPVGRTATQLLGAPNPRWAELYGQVLDTDAPLRVEEPENTLGRVFDLNIFRLGDPADRRVAVLFYDITARKKAEAALRQREADLARVQRIGQVGGLDIDVADGLTSRRSPEYLRLHGLPPDLESETHADWLARVHPDDRAAADIALLAALEGPGDGYQNEYRIVRPSDGSVRWIHARADIERDGEGRAIRLRGAHVDVTDQKQAQAAWRESDERFRQFGEASQDVIWIRDAETLQWQYLTPAFEDIYGLSRREALEGDNFRSWLDLIVFDDRAGAMTNIQRVREGEHVTFEYRVRRPIDGAIRWLRNSDFPIMDETGRVRLVGGIGHDLTELRETEARLQTLMQGIPQLVWRADELGLWTWASPQWTGFTGQSAEDSLDFGWLAMVHPDDRAPARAAWSEARARGGFEVECRIRNAESSAYRWFQTRAAPVRDESGMIVEWLGTSTDIHDLRDLQERQKILVAELQHRTRNLMAVVRSMSEKTARSSPDLADFRTRFSDRIDALSRVQGLLSRLDDHDRVTFDELIEAELRVIADHPDQISLSGPAGVRLRSSTVQTLAMALHELATNALKYGALAQPSGRLKIAWSVEQDPGDASPWLHIDWRETGVAMPPPGSPPAGTGQGRELIERALPYQLQARTTYRLGPDGVHCTIAMSISKTGQFTEEGDIGR